MAASARGYYLRWWRYGPETERLVQEALERDHWSAARWKAWQEERLAFVLHRAATQVPYYRAQWSERRRHGDKSSWEQLENWPILKKEALRATPTAFVADNYQGRRLFKEHTSGTTGTPLTLWCDRSAERSWYALFEARWRRWYGVSFKDRWAILGGQLIAPFKETRPPFWVWNAGLNQLYMSVLHLRPDCVRHYLDAIRGHSISYLYGYSSSLYWLALGAIEHGVKLHLQVVVTDAEPLFPWQREVIERAFHCPVRETYGLAEMVAAASECESGRLHLWPEAGYIETLDERARPVAGCRSGRLVATGLLNEAMPLVRYETGDMLQPTGSSVGCPCGRSLALVDQVTGRQDDAILTRDGRRIVQIDTAFGTDMPILEAQIVQETLDKITVRVVPDRGWSREDEQNLCEAMRERVGEMDIRVVTVPMIERTWAGKYRIIVSRVTNPVQPLTE